MGTGRQIRTIILIAGVFLVTGCASLGTYNPATGKKEFLLLNANEETALGLQSHRELMQNYVLSKEQVLWDQMNRIGPRLAAVSDRQDYEYKFFIVESDELNAFTTPGGYIYMYTGLMKALETDDRIAGVVAHEIGHCAAKHVAKKFQTALGYNLIYNIALSTAGDYRQSIQIGADTVMDLGLKAYSRKDEYEADRLGVKYTTLAGFNPRGLIEGFEILRQREKKSRVPGIFRTHPTTEKRMKALEREVALSYRYLK